jgi:uncharacterized protein YgbK (DUF1537 family)
MPSLRLFSFAMAIVLVGCSKKVTQSQCDTMVQHYAELVVRDTKKDASAEEIKAEQEREKNEAKSDDAFRNCTSEIEPADYDCAMKADSADAMEKCLE